MIVVRILPTYLHSSGVIADNSGLFHSLIVQDCLNLHHQIRLHYVHACGFMLVGLCLWLSKLVTLRKISLLLPMDDNNTSVNKFMKELAWPA